MNLIKRPELNYRNVSELDTDRFPLENDVIEEIDIMNKYEGYINKQLEQVEQFKKIESKLIPENFDYDIVRGLRAEATQKLSLIKPRSVGQASRISGVSPADMSVLMIHLEQYFRRINNNNASEKK